MLSVVTLFPRGGSLSWSAVSQWSVLPCTRILSHCHFHVVVVSVVVFFSVASFVTVWWFSWLSKVGRVTARFQSPAEMDG